jgi:hypothetical protein
LNVPFAIEKCISFSALSSKMNRPFVWQKAMRIKQGLTTYNAPIYLRTECSERKKWRGPNKKKNPWIQIWFIICAPNLIRITICTGRLRCANIMAQGWSYCIIICGQNMFFLFITQGYIDAPNNSLRIT